MRKSLKTISDKAKMKNIDFIDFTKLQISQKPGGFRRPDRAHFEAQGPGLLMRATGKQKFSVRTGELREHDRQMSKNSGFQNRQ